MPTRRSGRGGRPTRWSGRDWEADAEVREAHSKVQER